MINWYSLEEVPTDFAGTAVTIGKFDGVHLGHQALLSELVDAADNASLAPVVLTFTNHPDEVFKPGNSRPLLIGPNQKSKLLEEFGVAATLNLEFTRELASVSAEDFVVNFLVKGLAAKVVVVGHDFRFGSKGAGNVDLLRELGAVHGFQVREVAPVDVDGEVVSSTRIRNLLDQGEVTTVAKLLGRNHSTVGMVEHGLKIGREIGFPTANMSRTSEGYLPRDAVYAGWLIDGDERYPAALSVGINETFEAVPRLLEVHVLDRRDLNLYDHVVEAEYVDFIRPAAKFDGVESLVEAINADLDQIRAILKGH